MSVASSSRRGRPADAVHMDRGERGGLDAAKLEEFVLTARFELLAQRMFDTDAAEWVIGEPETQLSRKQIVDDLRAFSMFPDTSALRNMLSGHRTFNDAALLRYEHELQRFAVEQCGAPIDALRSVGWLTTFRHELSGEAHVRAPLGLLGRWHDDLCRSGPTTPAAAMVLGEALLDLASCAHDHNSAEIMRASRSAYVDRSVRGVVSVAGRPLRSGSMRALQLASAFGSWSIPAIDEHLRSSPMGFRLVRVLARNLESAARTAPPWWSPGASLERDSAWSIVERLVGSCGPTLDPYPARGLTIEPLEAAVSAGSDLPFRLTTQARGMLMSILSDDRWAMRSHVYAAHTAAIGGAPTSEILGLVASRSTADDRLEHLRELLACVDDCGSVENALISIDGAFSSTAAKLVSRQIDTAGRSSTHLPFIERLPMAIRDATRELVSFVLLTPSETWRRRGCDALREAGVTIEAAGVIGRIMGDADCPAWLGALCAFTLGHLAEPACCDDLEAAATAGDPELAHAALFALGDIGARSSTTIETIIEQCSHAAERPASVVHAGTYALAAMLPKADDDLGHEQLAQLERLSARPHDLITRSLARWGLDEAKRVSARAATQPDVELWGLASLAPPK